MKNPYMPFVAALFSMGMVQGQNVPPDIKRSEVAADVSPVEVWKTYQLSFIKDQTNRPSATYKVLRILKEPWVEVESSYVGEMSDGKNVVKRTITDVFILNLNAVEIIYPWKITK